MKKNPRIIRISGIQGIFLIGFVVTCLFAGFVVFPARVAMYAWNYIASNYYIVPAINVWQGLLLWIMTALSVYLITRKNKVISFKQPMELSEQEMSILMERIKMQKQAQKLRTMIIKTKESDLTKTDTERENSQTSNNMNGKNL